MYKLKTNGSDTWGLETNYNGTFVGSFKQVVSFAIISLGFSISELETAALEMNEKGHNCAEFGVRRTLIYTHNEEK